MAASPDRGQQFARAAVVAEATAETGFAEPEADGLQNDLVMYWIGVGGAALRRATSRGLITGRAEEETGEFYMERRSSDV